MSTVNIVYWSGTGNTQAMAMAVAKGVSKVGGTAEVKAISEVSAEQFDNETVFALGCPSMGAEQLEDSEMEPFVEELCKNINGKNVFLFGSYGWGDGEWMRDWEERMKQAGAVLLTQEGVIVNGEPDEDTINRLMEAGSSLASL